MFLTEHFCFYYCYYSVREQPGTQSALTENYSWLILCSQVKELFGVFSVDSRDVGNASWVNLLCLPTLEKEMWELKNTGEANIKKNRKQAWYSLLGTKIKI